MYIAITGIYKIVNMVNGKVYIGQSIDIEKRWAKHRRNAFNPNDKGYNYPLYSAIRKYGVENFSFEILEECSRNELNEKEIYYIKEYKSNQKSYGYNIVEGGGEAPHTSKLSENHISEIIQRLKTTSDNNATIGADYNISSATVRDINVGKVHRREGETYPIRERISVPNSYHLINKPEALKLAGLVKQHGFGQVGRMYGVEAKTVVDWCKKYKIPYHKAELISWYNKKMGIIDEEEPIKVKKNKFQCEKPVKQIDPISGEVIKVYKSASEAARVLGKSNTGSISNVCNGLRPTIYGFAWKFV